MILVYSSTTTTFTTNGLGSVWPTECIVTEELNGVFELELEHPIDDNGKWERLVKWNIIKAPTHRGDQPFRIYDVQTDPIEGVVKVKARHIFYDLLRNFIEDTRPTLRTGNEAGDLILAGCQYASGFTFNSDITGLSTAYYVRVNPVQAFIGDMDQSFVNRWGGEIERDNYTIDINARLGADNGVRIAYRKNLTGLSVKESTDKTYTRIMPLATDSDNSVLMLTAKYVDSARLASYPFPLITTVKFDDIKVGEDYATAALARTEMTARVNAMYAAGVDLPKITLDVEFVPLAQTEEYQQYAILADANLGDDVTVEYEPLDIDVKLRVVEVEYDTIRERYASMRIGDKIASLGTHITGVDIDIRNITDDMENKVGVGTAYNNVWISNEDGLKCETTIGASEITVTVNATDGIKVVRDTAVVFGISTDGYVYANRLYDPDDPLVYVQVGQVDASTSMFTLYRKTSSSYTDFRKRLQILTSGATATAISVPVRDTIDTDGSATFLINHGDAQLTLTGTYAGGGVSILECGDAEVRTSSVSGAYMDFTGGRVGINAGAPYITGLQVFANNAAAITGGLAAGDLYRTGATPDLVCVVH